MNAGLKTGHLQLGGLLAMALLAACGGSSGGDDSPDAGGPGDSGLEGGGGGPDGGSEGGANDSGSEGGANDSGSEGGANDSGSEGGANDSGSEGGANDSGSEGGADDGGSSGACADRPAGFVCRPAADECDTEEVCDGTSTECPADSFAAAGSACDDGLYCTATDECDGAGSCVGTGDPCQASSDDGDTDCSESCNEDANDCSGPDPDDSDCAQRACEVASCQVGNCVVTTACPIFVDSEGSDGEGCGSDWGSQACATPQGGSDEAERLGNERVFVREGTFTASGTDPMLRMASAIRYYGGFAGTEATLDERAASFSHSVLDGQDMSDPVVVGASDSRLDGFEVRAGAAASAGAGMRNQSVENLTVAHCSFDANVLEQDSAASGAGVYNKECDSVTFSDVSFTNNTVGASGSGAGGVAIGAAMYNADSNIEIEGASFTGNTTAGLVLGYGGALAHTGGTLVLREASFATNQAQGTAARGGALYIDGAEADLEDVEFTDNDVGGANTSRGGGLEAVNSTVTLTQARFAGNAAVGNGVVLGGGLASQSSTLGATDVLFEDNGAASKDRAVGGGLGASGNGSVVALERTQFVGNSARAEIQAGGGAVSVSAGSFEYTHGDVVNNDAEGPTALAGGVFLLGPPNTGAFVVSADVQNVGFYGNVASGATEDAAGGGVLMLGDASAAMSSVSFVDNSVSGSAAATLVGAGLFVFTGGTSPSLSMDNVVMGANAGAGDLGTNGTVVLSLGHVCSAADPGADQHTSFADFEDALEEGPDGRWYLTADSVCKDTGDHAAASALFGNGGWQSYTTQLDGTLDTGTVDHGRHYLP